MGKFYQFARAIVYCFIKPLFRVEVIGKEHFPMDGAVLLCSNHINNLDPPTIGIVSPRQLRFMAKEELFKIPVFSLIVRALGAFPVKRGFSDREALRTGLKILKEREVLAIFPEGTRSKTGELGKGLAGAGFFALRSDCVVLPCAVVGSYKPFRKTKVIFGPAIDFTPYRNKKISAEEATDKIMTEIRKLLEKYR
mgnify:CR=1 FL=1